MTEKDLSSQLEKSTTTYNKWLELFSKKSNPEFTEDDRKEMKRLRSLWSSQVDIYSAMCNKFLKENPGPPMNIK